MNHLLDVTGPIDSQPAQASVADGAPAIGFRRLAEFAASKVGVWEMTPGTVTDVEVDEVFFVLAGSATLVFEDETTLTLSPGATVRLHAGDKTTWTVHETLRKIYIC
jgi:uncharacterized cupin superfamily protein